MPSTPPAITHVATARVDDVVVRGKSLCRELIGRVTFTEMTYLAVVGVPPTRAQAAVVDACLVALMEHGLTPSVLATRLVVSSAPEALQGAIAAGLLGVGSVFVGTVEGCAALLSEALAAGDGLDAACDRIAAVHHAEKRAVPGFGHPLHRPDDPRTPRILAVADQSGVSGRHVAALRSLARAVDAAFGRHLTINATGAIAAALCDAGVPAGILRGFAVLARCAGLVAHAHEERGAPAMRAIWEAAEAAVPYEEEP